MIYLLQVNLRLSPSITELGSLYTVGSSYFHFWQFFTYMFLHDPYNWMHLIGNMFGLISLGPMLARPLGPIRDRSQPFRGMCTRFATEARFTMAYAPRRAVASTVVVDRWNGCDQVEGAHLSRYITDLTADISVAMTGWLAR